MDGKQNTRRCCGKGFAEEPEGYQVEVRAAGNVKVVARRIKAIEVGRATGEQLNYNNYMQPLIAGKN